MPVICKKFNNEVTRIRESFEDETWRLTRGGSKPLIKEGFENWVATKDDWITWGLVEASKDITPYEGAWTGKFYFGGMRTKFKVRNVEIFFAVYRVGYLHTPILHFRYKDANNFYEIDYSPWTAFSRVVGGAKTMFLYRTELAPIGVWDYWRVGINRRDQLFMERWDGTKWVTLFWIVDKMLPEEGFVEFSGKAHVFYLDKIEINGEL